MKMHPRCSTNGTLTRTMQLYWRQTQLLGNVRVLQLACLVDGLALDPFGRVRARSNSRTATERLEFGVNNLAILVHFDLQLHDISASWGSNQSGADGLVLLVHRADITWILVMVQHLCENEIECTSHVNAEAFQCHRSGSHKQNTLRMFGWNLELTFGW